MIEAARSISLALDRPSVQVAVGNLHPEIRHSPERLSARASHRTPCRDGGCKILGAVQSTTGFSRGFGLESTA
jgi:hypothetical protein